jgi:hypothetical protein
MYITQARNLRELSKFAFICVKTVLVSASLIYSSFMMMEAIYSSETSVNLNSILSFEDSKEYVNVDPSVIRSHNLRTLCI